jgi:hypothetical protein
MFHVHFDPERCTANMEHVGYFMVDELPSHLDIAGGYIIASGPGTDIYDGGPVKMIRWKDMQAITLPPVSDFQRNLRSPLVLSMLLMLPFSFGRRFALPPSKNISCL